MSDSTYTRQPEQSNSERREVWKVAGEEWRLPEAGGRNGELIFNGDRVSVLQDSGDPLLSDVNILNTTELHT